MSVFVVIAHSTVPEQRKKENVYVSLNAVDFKNNQY